MGAGGNGNGHSNMEHNMSNEKRMEHNMSDKFKEDPWGGYGLGIVMKEDVDEARWVTKPHGNNDGSTYRCHYVRVGTQWYAADPRSGRLDGPTKYYGIRWECSRLEQEKLESGATAFDIH